MTQREFNNKLMSIAQSNYPLPKPVDSKWMRFYMPTLQPLLFKMGYDLPFSNDVFAWGYSAAQCGIILKTPEYYKLLQAAYLNIAPNQKQAIESLYNAPQPVDATEQSNAPQPVDTTEQSNAPQPVDKFTKQIYTAYWQEVKRGNIKEKSVTDLLARQDIKCILDRCIKAGLIEQTSIGQYRWMSDQINEFAYFVYVVNEQTDKSQSIRWQPYLSIFENDFKAQDLSKEVSKRIKNEILPTKHLKIRNAIVGKKYW